MSDYTELKGLKVKYLAADPNPGTAGDVWYNTTSRQLKGFVGRAAWHSSSPMTEGRTVQNGGTGPVSAALFSGGNPGAGAGVNKTELYDGSGWSTGGNLNTTRVASAACGTATAAIHATGEHPSGPSLTVNAETYDGSSWTEGPNVNTARWRVSSAAAAPSTASIIFLGELAPGTNQALTETYDGSSWTEGPDLNTARGDSPGGAGTSTATIAFGGDSGSLSATAETFDGSSWTEGPDLNTARDYLGSSGTSTSAVAFGGTASPGTSNATELYDGTSWTNSSNLGNATSEGGRAGTTGVTGLYARGNPGNNGATEEFNNSFQVFTAGAWASGPAINTGRRGFNQGGVGTATAGLIIGGSDATNATNKTEEYDGSSWTETGNYPSNLQNSGSAGTQTAAYNFGGHDGSNLLSAGNTYNGSSWSGGTALPAARWQNVGGGTSTSAISVAGATSGSPVPSSDTTLEWDGSSWTEGGDLSTARRYHSGFGVQTSFAAFGGKTTPGTDLSSTEEYNGTAWTSGGSYFSTIRGNNSPASPGSSDGISVGGYPAVTSTAKYDGTAWATNPSVATGKHEMGCIGTSSDAIKTGGNPGNVTTTEIFTAEATADTASTIDFD